MSLSRIYKITTEIATQVLPVELDQISSKINGRTITARKAAAPTPPTASSGEPARALEPDNSELELRSKRLEEAQMRFNEAAQALTLALEETAGLRKSILIASTDDMLRLVLAIAEQVVQRELQTDPEIIARIINQALNAAIKSDMFHVKVSPEDFALVQERKPLFLASLSGLKNISFEADPQIAKGGCLVESELGQVDATLEARMAEIRQQLFNSVPPPDATTGCTD